MATHATSFATDKQFAQRLDQARIDALRPLDRSEVTEIVRQIIGSLEGDFTAADLKLYKELEELARYIQHAKAEIAQLCPGEICDSHIPSATDELDAVVGATEAATNTIMDGCDAISAIATGLAPEIRDKLIDVTTRVFEACNFQDVTGQRITKVVRTLKHIEEKIDALVVAFGEQGDARGPSQLVTAPVSMGAPPSVTGDEAALLHGPQLPGKAVDQDEIDRLLASFD
ncbi:chemotaxis protein CheZ [uncultured Gammaproteobacteria bacterium]